MICIMFGNTASCPLHCLHISSLRKSKIQSTDAPLSFNVILELTPSRFHFLCVNTSARIYKMIFVDDNSVDRHIGYMTGQVSVCGPVI